MHDGLEYLFGYADRDGRHVPLWALSRTVGKEMFERSVYFPALLLSEPLDAFPPDVGFPSAT